MSERPIRVTLSSPSQIGVTLGARVVAGQSSVHEVLQNGVSVLEDGIARVTVPTKVSEIQNDTGFITASALNGYATETYVNNHHDASKQDVINDLSSIRSGAAAGATAVQPAAISDMATKTWTEAQGYLTEHQSLADYSTTVQMNAAIEAHHDSTKQDTISDLSSIRTGAGLGATAVQPSAISDMATKTWTQSQGYLTEHQSLANYSTTSEMNTAINAHHDATKQDVISDLSAIRTGAASGATAVQPSAISDMATKTWVEGKGYLTEHQSLADYSTTVQMNAAISAHHDSTKQNTISDLDSIRSGASAGATAVQPAAISDMATKTWTQAQGYLTEHQSLTNYATKTWVEDKNYYSGTPVEDVKLNGTTVVDANHVANISTIDNVTSAGNQSPLSANQGKLLNDRINNLEAMGTYLAIWDSNRGLPTTNPQTMPYTYKTGNYYRIGLMFTYCHEIHYDFNSSEAIITVYTNSDTVMTHLDLETWLRTNGYKEESTAVGPLNLYKDIAGTYHGDQFGSCYVEAHDAQSSTWQLKVLTVGGTSMTFSSSDYVSDTVTNANKYKPNGSQYTGAASTTFDTDASVVGDFWFYDGSVWSLLINHIGGTITDVQKNGVSVVSGGVANVVVPAIPTNVSAFTNDAGYLTQHQSLANYSTTAEMNIAISAHHDSTKQDTLPQVVNNRYLHTNMSTGNLEWSEVNGGGDDASFGVDDILQFTDGTNTPVEANPTAQATEALAKLTVGTTTYSVGGGGDAVWGGITGTLSNQTDLQSALDGKQSLLPQVVNDRYLHANASTGALEWSEAQSGSTTWGTITGTLSNQTDLSSELNAKEVSSNKVISLTAQSTDTQYPSAKCVYDIVGNIEATLQVIRGVV